MNEMIGRVDRIQPQRPLDHWKARGLDFSRVVSSAERVFGTELHRSRDQNHELEKQLDHELIRQAAPALENKEPVRIEMAVQNIDRSVGAMLAGEVARRYADEGLPDNTIEIQMRGTAGQSFGAFINRGITLTLIGDANDYAGKGLSGGRLIVKTPEQATFDPTQNIIIGNTSFYGATAGEAYINGLAGERFCVRNSGLRAVVEGVGDHGCEYMTGGRVVVIGDTGRNFAAGMSGGIAYVWDPRRSFSTRVNQAMVDLDPLIDPEEIDFVLHMITRHKEYTDSRRAEQILQNWASEAENFVKVIPGEYKLALIKLEEEKESRIAEIKVGAESP